MTMTLKEADALTIAYNLGLDDGRACSKNNPYQEHTELWRAYELGYEEAE